MKDTPFPLESGIIYQVVAIPCVYLQNSGLGNAIDPITNLISKDIIIATLMIIGWRGART